MKVDPRMLVVAAVAALAAGLGLVSPAAAQFAAGISAGAFVPTANLYAHDEPTAAVRYGQRPALATAVHVRYWLGDALSAEVRGVFSRSKVAYEASTGSYASGETIRPGYAFATLASLGYAVVNPAFEPYAVHLQAGLGLIWRGGDFLADDSVEGDGATVAGVLGVGATYAIARAVHARVDCQDVISSFGPVEGAASELQQDFVISLGLEWTIGEI